MAVLSNADRVTVWERLMRDAGVSRAQLALIKTDLKAAVDAADAWADSNAGSYNSALPLPARTALTAQQKAMLLTYVITRRYETA